MTMFRGSHSFHTLPGRAPSPACPSRRCVFDTLGPVHRWESPEMGWFCSLLESPQSRDHPRHQGGLSLGPTDLEPPSGFRWTDVLRQATPLSRDGFSKVDVGPGVPECGPDLRSDRPEPLPQCHGRTRVLQRDVTHY